MSSPIKASIRNIRTVTVLFGVGLLCFVWVGLFFIVQSERKTESDSALKETANYARMFEEHTIRTIKGLDQIVLLLKYQVEKEGTVDIPRLVKEKRFEGQPFVQLGVTDEKGELKATSIVPFVNTTLGDREHFLVHKDHSTFPPDQQGGWLFRRHCGGFRRSLLFRGILPADQFG